jgi:acetyl esterase/lipase
MKHLLLLCLFFAIRPVAGQEILPLWPNGVPDTAGDEEADVPSLTVYLPEEGKATGAGIVICPGGGYGHLAMDHEGHQVARWLNGYGIAAFILTYRHAPGYRHPTPLRDAQRAIRTVRANSEAWGVEEGRLGILGFSAGGHLAASTGMQFSWQDPLADDDIGRFSARPDFMVLVYPVISMTEDYMHRGSRNNLLGEDAGEELATMMSHEKQVTPETPPAFLVHTTTDRAVPPENSIYLYLAMREAGVDAEMHIYEKGPHGFGLAPYDPVLSTWPARCIDWLRMKGFL